MQTVGDTAKAQTFENPVTGWQLVFRRRAADTAGEILETEWTGRHGWHARPLRIHRLQEERFEVMSGTLEVTIAGTKTIARPGDVVVVPAGVVHSARNAGSDDVRANVQFRPALRSETVLELVIGLETAKGGAPKDPLALAYIVREFDDELRLAQPPYPLQRLLFGPLAALARALRYPQRLQPALAR